MKTTKQIQSPHDMSLERNIPKQLIFEIRYQNQVNQVKKLYGTKNLWPAEALDPTVLHTRGLKST
jgi:hypothetical protein